MMRANASNSSIAQRELTNEISVNRESILLARDVHVYQEGVECAIPRKSEQKTMSIHSDAVSYASKRRILFPISKSKSHVMN
jgi:hypothetical protein